MATTIGSLKLKGQVYFVPEGQELEDAVLLGEVEIPVDLTFDNPAPKPNAFGHAPGVRKAGE